MRDDIRTGVEGVPNIGDDVAWTNVKGLVKTSTPSDDFGKRNNTREATPEHLTRLESKTNDNYLEAVFGKISGEEGFGKFLNFAGNVAQVESYRGEEESSEESSASGLFHILTGNGGGYSRNGAEATGGGYDSYGNRVRSSFDTAKKRLKNMMDRYASKGVGSIEGIEGFLSEIEDADDPKDLSREQQAMLLYADLKMRKGKDFDMFIDGDDDGRDLYSKKWVTSTGDHTKAGILENWKNALKRESKYGDDKARGEFNRRFFGLDGVQKVVDKATGISISRQYKYRRGGVVGNVDALAIIRGKCRMI